MSASLSPITNLQHPGTGHTVMQPENITIKNIQHKNIPQKYTQYMPAQSGAGELAEGVPEHLEPLAANVEEHGAVRLPGLGVQLGHCDFMYSKWSTGLSAEGTP